MKFTGKACLRAFSFILIFPAFTAFADIKLPLLIAHGMVLQRDTKLKIWGWAEPGEKVNIELPASPFQSN